MVAVKKPTCKKDLSQSGLDLQVKEDFLFAKDTSLGGDDGIAIAYMLAILDSHTISHPDLECIFTADEEIGMLGATALDVSSIKGKTLINIDSEDEGIFTVGCAGGLTAIAKINSEKEKISSSSPICTISLSGLKGGHSGVEIYPDKMNANIIIGRILYELSQIYDLNIIRINGGEKDNAIANFAQASFSINTLIDKSEFENITNSIFKNIYDDYRISDPDANLKIDFYNALSEKKEELYCFNKTNSNKILQALILFPNGIQLMEQGMENMVHSSLNLGIIDTKNDYNNKKASITFSFSIRSSSKAKKMDMYNKIKEITTLLGGSISYYGDYPGWKYNSKSAILQKAKKTYRQLYNNDAKIESIHAGLECGIFAEKINNLDAISIGPQMYDIHTFNEKLSISSTKRTWDFILHLIKE